MNKRDLTHIVAYETDLSRSSAAAAIDSLFDAVAAALKDGDRVQITGFGTFSVRERQARTGRNPRTGEAVAIPASKAPAFKAAKALKDSIND